MSKYTTELRFICEQQSGLDESVGYNDVNTVISNARPKIFSFTYPIFDEAYKPTLETKILKHFYTREIGLETYGLWKLKLDTRLNEIMPYYNKLYESELLEFNPLYTHDIKTTGYKHNSGEDHDDISHGGRDVSTLSGTDSSINSGNDVSRLSGTDTRASADKTNTWDLYSDTPQGGINGIQAAEDDPSLATNGYLTNARHIIGDTDGSTGSTTYGRTDTLTHGKTTNTTYGKTDTLAYGKTEDKDGTFDNETDYWETVQGYMGRNPSKSLLEFRTTFLNIDMMIIEELEDLFFQLW